VKNCKFYLYTPDPEAQGLVKKTHHSFTLSKGSKKRSLVIPAVVMFV